MRPSLTETELTKTVLRAVNEDTESTSYKILAILKKHRQNFAGKELYPHIAKLIESYHELKYVNEREDFITNNLQEKEIAEIDLVNEILRREDLTDEEVQESIHDVLDLIDWALPLIREVIDEGKEVFEYTSSKIDIDWVNLVSRYLDEGYLIISAPDWGSEVGRKLRAYSYERQQISVKSGETYHKLDFKSETAWTESRNPEEFKKRLLANRSAQEKAFHQNPATILATASVPYSFPKTVFPVTKRKFMRWLKKEDNTDSTALQKT